ncbi:MAG: HAMP domain-containing histidine kinase [Pseudomonadales bacterium]|nr:HAMP domain-containing histidine kinase [Pseudomonadales bacterium]
MSKFFKSSSFRLALTTLLLIWVSGALLLFWVSQSVINFSKKQVTEEIQSGIEEIIEVLPRLNMEKLYGDIDIDEHILELEHLEDLSFSQFLREYVEIIQQELDELDNYPVENKEHRQELEIAKLLLRARLFLLEEISLESAANMPIADVHDLIIEETADEYHDRLEPLMEPLLEEWREHHQKLTELTRESVLAYVEDEELIDNEWLCFALIDPQDQILVSSHHTTSFNINERMGDYIDVSIPAPASELNASFRCLATAITIANQDNFYFGHRPVWYFKIKMRLERMLLVGLALTFLFAIGATWFLSRRTLTRIESINNVCNQIREGDLTQRLTTNGSGDDFDDLAININNMLDQIQELMLGVQDVTDNIAHDLRTPLTRLRGQLDLMMRMDNLDKSSLQSLVIEVDHVLSMFSGLLRIARIEKGKRKVAFHHFDVNPIINDLCDFFEPAFEEKHIQVSKAFTPEPLIINGDPDLFTQAISNLMDNAFKYTPEHGNVHMTTTKRGNRIIISIEDSGPGIPDHEKENVFKRFYRLEKHRGGKGTGLGLSLVKAICDLHQAKIQLNNAQGLTVTIEIDSAH